MAESAGNQTGLDPASSIASPDSGAVGIEAGYGALKTGAGVRLCSERTIIRMSGDDRASFLHGMCSNDIKGLKPGGLIAALFLTERAHLIAEAVVWATADALLLEMERSQWPAVRAHLERFLVADDVEMEESVAGARYGSVIQMDGPRASEALAAAFGEPAARYGSVIQRVIQIDGPRASEAVAAAFGEPAALTGAWRSGEVDGGALVAQVTRWGKPAFTILTSDASASETVARLIKAAGANQFGQAGEVGQVIEVSLEAAEIVRVESGIARVGVDTNDKTIALEARMEPAISFSKGCYIGQETIERATARGALKRRLMGLQLDASRVPDADARVMLAGKEVGHLTSPVCSPQLGVIGLGILHHSAWAPGTAVTIHDADGELAALVSELPFASNR
jgi:folate-binding protein YgfZ